MTQMYAFGARAQGYASRLTAETPTLVFEPLEAVAAQRCAVDLKRAYAGFDLITVYDEPRLTIGRFLAAHLQKSFQTYDERRLALDTLARNELVANGRPQREYVDVDAGILGTMRDIAALSDRWIVRSWTEYNRLVKALGIEPAAVERALAPYDLPVFERAPSDGSLVVWAPGQSEEDLFIITTALQEMRRPFSIASGLDSQTVQRCSTAALVIVAATDDPGPALAFAQLGIPTIAASTTGIEEYAAGIECYEPWNRISIFDAVARGLCARRDVSICGPLAPPIEPATAHSATPLVSLLVRTFNRPQLLRRALQSIADQRYAPLEAIVVNNGGEDVTEICASFENVRYFSIPAGNINLASNVALVDASGTYCGFLDDDDALFVDHVERLVAALERSGAPAAYADALNVYLRPIGGNFAVTGYSAILVPAVAPSLMLSRCVLVGSPRVLFRRDLLQMSGGFFDELAVAGDYEAWLRLVLKGDFVRVNAVTALYSQFSNKTNISLRDGEKYHDAHKRIFERYPVERPGINAERQAVLDAIKKLGGLGMSGPSQVLDPQPLLLPN